MTTYVVILMVVGIWVVFSLEALGKEHVFWCTRVHISVVTQAGGCMVLPWWLLKVNIFAYVCWSFGYPISLKCFCCFSNSTCQSSFYILNMNSLWNTGIADVSSPFAAFPSLFSQCIVWCTEALNLVQFIYLSLIFSTSCVLFKESVPAPMLWRPSMSSSKDWIVLTFTFRSAVHEESICMCDVSKFINFLLLL